ncbi:MAG TPA: hypothetical protein VMJ32_11345 [Pirellulales bacterium]|nr:hypothetical protein [Pirellulales bacterium]
MSYLRFHWDHPDDPDGNFQHILENDLTIDDVAYAVRNAVGYGSSRSSELPCLWGYTPDETYIIVIYQEIDEISVRIVTAYKVPEPA